MRFGSYPQSCFRKLFTVSTVGEAAVKNLGFTGGKGSALVCESSEFKTIGAGGFCSCGAAAPACPCATAETPNTEARPANIQIEIFKEPFLLPPLSAGRCL